MANATSTTTANVTSGADNSIEALLQRRAQYEQWLARLESTAEKAPGVRDRVRADYQARLDNVIDELRGHSATIAEELEHHRTVERRLNTERKAVEEALAEAEVRHMVGEYGDDEWERLSGESERQLGGLRQELDTVGMEIARLAEVQSLIASPGRVGTSAAAAPAPMSAPAIAQAIAQALAPVPPAAVPAPAPTAAPTPVQLQAQLEIEPAPIPTPVATAPTPVPQPVTPAPAPVRQPEPEPVDEPSPIDELAFLKSVSDDDRKPAVPSPRRSGGAGSVPAAAMPAKASEPVAAPSAPAPSAAPSVPAATGTAKAGMAKTLKCNECGTFNRPTEWYCERCGAELAAL